MGYNFYTQCKTEGGGGCSRINFTGVSPSADWHEVTPWEEPINYAGVYILNCGGPCLIGNTQKAVQWLSSKFTPSRQDIL